MPKTFVTGATGFVGLHLVRRLLEAGHAVRAMVRASSDTSRLADLDVDLVEADLLDAESVGRAMDGCTQVYHLAGDTTYDRKFKERQFAANVDGTRHIVQAACRLGVERLMHTSTCAAVNASWGPDEVFDEDSAFELHDSGLNYSVSKWQGEQLVLDAHREHGLDVRICHPAETYGEEDSKLVTAGNLVEAAKSPIAMAIPGGTGVVYVGDLVEGVMLAMERGRAGRRYILSSENLTVRQIIAIVLKWLGKDKRIFMLPRWLLMGMARTMKFLRLSPPIDPDVASYACRYWFVDATRARTELGWSPISGADAIGRTMRWLVEAGHLPEPDTAVQETGDAS